MSLMQQQQVLARLLTDPEFRARFEQDRPTTLASLGLVPDDHEALLGMAQAQLQLFAESLLQKRLQMVQKLLPRSYELMGENFRDLFRRYASQPIPDTSQKHLQDALQFVVFLRRELPANQLLWRELTDYEAVVLQTRLPGRGLILRRYHWPVWRAQPETRQPALCLWLRLMPERPWWHLRIPLTVKANDLTELK